MVQLLIGGIWWNELPGTQEGTRCAADKHVQTATIDTVESYELTWLVVWNMVFIFHNIWDNPSH